MDDLASLQQPPAIEGILRRSRGLGFDMVSEPRTGALLRTLAASKPGGRLLELGTGTGAGTAWLLDGMDCFSELVSVDPDERVQAVARAALGTDPRLTLVRGDAAEFLPRQPPESFDLIFADAIPGKFERLPDALRLVKPGGFYVIDDLLPQANWPEGHGARVAALLDQLAGLDDFRVVRIGWASGLLLAVRTGSGDPAASS